mmetsp:Transcript_19518/g.23435  ORF Transcript_19518/g.23435 Transcript_19518/m.23435 type:complete len:202 (+) Transcript_19518:53-658(+)
MCSRMRLHILRYIRILHVPTGYFHQERIAIVSWSPRCPYHCGKLDYPKGGGIGLSSTGKKTLLLVQSMALPSAFRFVLETKPKATKNSGSVSVSSSNSVYIMVNSSPACKSLAALTTTLPVAVVSCLMLGVMPCCAMSNTGTNFCPFTSSSRSDRVKTFTNAVVMTLETRATDKPEFRDAKSFTNKLMVTSPCSSTQSRIA